MAETMITEKGFLLDLNGHLVHAGYSLRPTLVYDRARIGAPKWRIKEWDYYLINDDDYAVALTIGDMGYSGLLSASVIKLSGEGSSTTNSVMTALPLGRFRMPASSDEGTSYFENGRAIFEFAVEKGQRRIHVRFNEFADGQDLIVDALLDRQPRDSMVIATPWAEDPLAFYYNRKIVGMRASGSVKLGTFVHGFVPDRSFGLLDWGRGVWTRDNTWYWGFAQGWQDGRGHAVTGSHRFGLNLGYGFGDTSAASENMSFLDGHAAKLGTLRFDIPVNLDGRADGPIAQRYRLMEPWHIVDDEGRIDLTFTPHWDRSDCINAVVVKSDQHQVFGSYSGTVDTEGGPFTVANLLGAAEVVHNVY